MVIVVTKQLSIWRLPMQIIATLTIFLSVDIFQKLKLEFGDVVMPSVTYNVQLANSKKLVYQSNAIV